MAKKLYRTRNGKMLCGVCSGLGDYFDIDPTIIRLIWIVFAFFGGAGIFAYIISALVIPSENTIKTDGSNVNYQ